MGQMDGIKPCNVCKQRDRVGKKFCSDKCRNVLQFFKVNKQAKGLLCDEYMEIETCVLGDRCFWEHTGETQTQQKYDMILQIPKTHDLRIKSYLMDKFGVILERLDFQPAGVTQEEVFANKLRKDHSFICILLNSEENMLNFGISIQKDPLIALYIQNVYLVGGGELHTSLKAAAASMRQNMAVNTNLKIISTEKKLSKYLNIPSNQGIRILDNSAVYKLQDVVADKDTSLVFLYRTYKNYYYSKFINPNKIDALRFLEAKAYREGLHKLKPWPSKARFKVREVFLRYPILDSFKNTYRVAIDLGASPGGWTYFLANHTCGFHAVISVDPGLLASPDKKYSNIFEIRKKVEDLTCFDFESIFDAANIPRNQTIDVLVCSDMNIPFQNLVPLAFIEPEKVLKQCRFDISIAATILTVKKLKGKPAVVGERFAFSDTLANAKECLRRRFTSVFSERLMANRMSETTIVGSC